MPFRPLLPVTATQALPLPDGAIVPPWPAQVRLRPPACCQRAECRDRSTSGERKVCPLKHVKRVWRAVSQFPSLVPEACGRENSAVEQLTPADSRSAARDRICPIQGSRPLPEE